MIPHAFAIFDVDDVVVDMDGLAAAANAACRAPLVAALGPDVGDAVHRDFVAGYDTLRAQLRAGAGVEHEAYRALFAAIARWQQDVVASGHEVKLWSRHTLLAVALERHGAPVVGDLVHGVVDEVYWATIRERSRVTPDATATLRRLQAEDVPVHLATNSDGFLLFDETTGGFRYDPDHAVAEKKRRLQCVRTVGLEAEDITVGDPIGKPQPQFFERVRADFARKLGGSIDLSRTLAVGDSLTNDIEPLMRQGAGHGAWLLRNSPTSTLTWMDGPAPFHRRVVRIRRLTQLADVPWASRSV